MSHLSYRESAPRCYVERMKTIQILILILGVAGSAAAQLKEPGMLTAEDKQGIATTIDHFVEGWKLRDMEEFGSALTDDCDWVNIVGMHWHGKQQVVSAHKRLLETRYKGVNIHDQGHDETEIAPGVAIVIWRSQVDDFTTPEGQRVTAMRTMGTLVMVKVNGKWLIRSGQNSTIDEMAARHDPGRP